MVIDVAIVLSVSQSAIAPASPPPASISPTFAAKSASFAPEGTVTPLAEIAAINAALLAAMSAICSAIVFPSAMAVPPQICANAASMSPTRSSA